MIVCFSFSLSIYNASHIWSELRHGGLIAKLNSGIVCCPTGMFDDVSAPWGSIAFIASQFSSAQQSCMFPFPSESSCGFHLEKIIIIIIMIKKTPRW